MVPLLDVAPGPALLELGLSICGLAFLLVACVAVPVVVALRVVRVRAERAIAAMDAELAGEGVVLRDDAASFFGQTSRGVTQVRGNGVLVLTDAELRFRMWVGDVVLVVPRGRITSVTTPRSHLGKSRGAALLCLAFTRDDGQADSAAWQVADLERWMAALA